MPAEEEVDRAAILARRRRFILAALGGLSGVSGCTRAEPAPPSWPSTEPRELVDAHLEHAQSPPEPPAIAVPTRSLTYEELFFERAAPIGHYIFTDFDRLSRYEVECAAAFARALQGFACCVGPLAHMRTGDGAQRSSALAGATQATLPRCRLLVQPG